MSMSKPTLDRGGIFVSIAKNLAKPPSDKADYEHQEQQSK